MVSLFGKKPTPTESVDAHANTRIIRTLKTDLIQLNLKEGGKEQTNQAANTTVPQPSFPEPREERPREKTPEKISLQSERLMINPFQETGLRIPTPPPAPKAPPAIKTIHTFTSDVAENIQKNKTTLVEIAQLEEAKRRQTEEAGKQKAKSISFNIILIILGILFLTGGGAATYWFINRTKEVPLISSPTNRTELFKFEQVVNAKAGSTKTSTELAFSKAIEGVGVGEIKRIIFTDIKNQPLTSIGFLRALEIEEPDLFSSITDFYVLGVHKQSAAKTFLILQSENPELSYLSLIKWEKDLFRDLQNTLLVPQKSKVIPPFYSTNQAGHQYTFEDGAVQSKDIRVARDEKGQIVLLYGFLDQEYFIITTDPETFKEVFNRFTKARYIQ